MLSVKEVCVKLLSIGERQARLASELEAEQKATDGQIALAAALRDETLNLAGVLMETPVPLADIIASAAEAVEADAEGSAASAQATAGRSTAPARATAGRSTAPARATAGRSTAPARAIEEEFVFQVPADAERIDIQLIPAQKELTASPVVEPYVRPYVPPESRGDETPIFHRLGLDIRPPNYRLSACLSDVGLTAGQRYLAKFIVAGCSRTVATKSVRIDFAEGS